MKIPTPASNRARHLGLAGPFRSDRLVAEQEIRDLGPDAVPFQLQVIEEQRRQRRRWRPFWFTLYVASVLGLALSNPFLLQYGDPRLAIATLVCSLIGVFFFSLRYQQRSNDLERRAGALLAQIAEKEHIGTLVEMLDLMTEKVYPTMHRTVQSALTQILPRLQASDADRLTPAHRKVLAKRLTPAANPNDESNRAFTLALLEALKQVGDGSFIEPVRALTGVYLFGRSDPVRQAAEECLPYLEYFAEQEQKRSTLVRAAAPPSAQESSRLVRPAGNGSRAETQALLVRPVGEEVE